MILRPSSVLAAVATMILAFSGARAGTAPVLDQPVLAHVVEAAFDLDAHTVTVTDRITLPEGVAELRLGEAFAPEGSGWETAEDEDGTYRRLDLAAAGLGAGDVLELTYGATLYESVEGLVFSRENIGREITATVSEEGIYLSASSGWLAWAEGAMATHDLTLDTPAGFETVTQGDRVLHEQKGDRLHTRWVAAHPSDGLTLVANAYVVHAEPVREGVVAQTFFLKDDPRLRATYMERTRAYLAMYEEMIGPYPYAKFATVENWFPTGYGMPSYTLLGGQVLRLPFIPYTSFGHEIAHNWWGNAVFVDVAQGNWCEGLTSYCADYHYKELESDAAAREYRRNMLKDYAAYVTDPAQDFPLTEFKSRHSGATRAVGYGKSMMVFHMADRAVGREAFLAGLQDVARTHLFAEASWGDFLAAIGQAGGRDLAGGFAAQWLERTGAPGLSLVDVEFSGDRVAFTLSQTEPLYALEVPVVVTTAAGDVEHVLAFDEPSREFEIEADGPKAVAVDPDYHLFRRLDPAEIEPTISQVLGAEDPLMVMDDPDSTFLAAGAAFARDFTETEDPGLETGGVLPTGGRAAVVLNPGPELLRKLGPEGLVVSGSTLFLEGRRYDLNQFDLVFAAAAPAGDATCLVILAGTPEAMESLARRVGHYGKYSWLVVPRGQGRVERGNWPPGPTALTVRR